MTRHEIGVQFDYGIYPPHLLEMKVKGGLDRTGEVLQRRTLIVVHADVLIYQAVAKPRIHLVYLVPLVLFQGLRPAPPSGGRRT
jgi:hypothetical protein